MYKKDCFAFREITETRCKCDALDMLYCREGKCSFYKNKDKYEKELRRLEAEEE